MRLYVNKKEIPVLQKALISFVTANNDVNSEIAYELYERVNLCAMLQDNEGKAKENEIYTFVPLEVEE